MFPVIRLQDNEYSVKLNIFYIYLFQVPFCQEEVSRSNNYNSQFGSMHYKKIYYSNHHNNYDLGPAGEPYNHYASTRTHNNIARTGTHNNLGHTGTTDTGGAINHHGRFHQESFLLQCEKYHLSNRPGPFVWNRWKVLHK